MSGYEIKRNKDKYYFVLYPRNNNNQELGMSVEYNTIKECEKAIERFRSHVKVNTIDSPDSKFIKRSSSGRQIIDDKGKVMFFPRNTSSPKTTIRSIFNHIDDEIK